jgi:hypothetical protein
MPNKLRMCDMSNMPDIYRGATHTSRRECAEDQRASTPGALEIKPSLPDRPDSAPCSFDLSPCSFLQGVIFPTHCFCCAIVDRISPKIPIFEKLPVNLPVSREFRSPDRFDDTASSARPQGAEFIDKNRICSQADFCAFGNRYRLSLRCDPLRTCRHGLQAMRS